MFNASSTVICSIDRLRSTVAFGLTEIVAFGLEETAGRTIRGGFKELRRPCSRIGDWVELLCQKLVTFS